MRQNTKFKGKRVAALAMCGALGLSFFAGGLASALGKKGVALAADTSNTITVDAGRQYQTLDGWGSTLAWWANEIGDWTKVNADGITQREYIMELLYGENGLDWNIARYNVGGGDNPSHTHLTPARNMPGFKGAREKTQEEKDETGFSTGKKGSASESGDKYLDYVPNDLYEYENEDGSIKNWQLTPDYNQLWVLDWIQNKKKTGTTDIMTEYFSNSPPYWMTGSGCAGGSESGTNPNPNMPEANLKAYVDYFLDVYEYLVKQGFKFDYLQPFNESTSGQWKGTSGTQEGCDFTVEQKVKVLGMLQEECEKRGIDLGYNFSDEMDSSKEVDVFKAVFNTGTTASNGMTGKDIIRNADKYTYHIYVYTTDSMAWMRRAANLFRKEVEMSEICWTRGGTHDTEDMTTAFQYSTTIIDALKYGGVQSYIFWQGVEDKVGQIGGGTNYGLLQGIYYTAEEAMDKGCDIASLGLSYQDVTVSKAYYVSGQYSKYLKKGYSMVECMGDRAIAAVSPDGNQIVIVKQNQGKGKDITVNLDGFNAKRITKITTDKTQNWGKEYLSVSGNSFKDTLTEDSVTTYVIDGVKTEGKSHFVDSSNVEYKGLITSIDNEVRPNMKYTVQEIETLINENPEKEALYLTFNSDDNSQAKNYVYGGTYYTKNPNDYMVLRFKGTGFSLVAPKIKSSTAVNIWLDPELTNGVPSTDDANMWTVDTSMPQSGEEWRSEVFRINGFPEGWHTVYVAPQAGHPNANDNYINFDGFFVIEEEDKMAGELSAPTLLDAAASAKDGKLYASYDADAALTQAGYGYFMEYRKPNGSWTRSAAVATDGVFADTPKFTADVYEVRVVAQKGADVRDSVTKYVAYTPIKEGVLYYVDCGTNDFTNKYAGRVMGTCNSVFDKDYGKDPATGLNWGAVNRTAQGYYANENAFASFASGDNTSDAKVTYKFTIPEAGTYKMGLGTYNPWDTRTATYSLTGEGMTEVTGTATSAKQAGVTAFEFETTQANTEITLTLTKATGDNPTLSLVVITESNKAIPLYADAASNYAEEGLASTVNYPAGTNYSDGANNTEITVTMSDGTQNTLTVGNNMTLDSLKAATDKNGDYLVATYSLPFDGMNDMVVTKQFKTVKLHSIVYYNIDSGSNGEHAAKAGLLQHGVYEQADDGEWGFVNKKDNGHWRDEAFTSSILEFNTGSGGYNLRGFPANENLKVTVGANVHDWSSRNLTVNFNGTEDSKQLKPEKNKGNVEEVYYTKANANGELQIRFITKTSGQNPLISFVKVESAFDGTNNLSAEYGDNKIALSNTVNGADVYVLDNYGNMLDYFQSNGTSYEWEKLDEVANEVMSLHFVQVVSGSTTTSEEAVVILPALDIRFERETLEEGGTVTIYFAPIFPEESKSSVSQFMLQLPEEQGATKVDLIEKFYFTTMFNGEYVALMTVDGVEYSYPFVVDLVDVIDLITEKSTGAFTNDPVTVTLTPTSTKGVDKMLVNNKEVALDGGSYAITATQNGKYDVVVLSQSGFKKAFTVEVDNIEPATPSLSMSVAFDFATGLKVKYNTNAAGGSLYVSVNGGAAQAVDGANLIATSDGKYEFYYENGVGAKSAKKTYYVTHDASKATLGAVSVDKNGNVTVSGAEATLYRAGDNLPLDNMSVAENGKYYLELKADGATEIVVLSTSAGADIDWAGVSNVANVALIVVFSLVAAGLVAGIVVLVVKRRKS